MPPNGVEKLVDVFTDESIADTVRASPSLTPPPAPPTHVVNQRPPSSRITSPVTNDASSANHAAHFAASCAVPARASGVRAMYLA